MKEIFNHIPPDPAKSSIREEALSLFRLGYESRTLIGTKDHSRKNSDIYIDRNSGEKFHKIDKEPQLQKLISLLSKGIINTSDIVEYEGKFFSHEQNADQIKDKSEKLLEEVTADLFILKHVFGDSDHAYYSKDSTRRVDEEPGHGKIKDNTFLQHANLLIDEENNKVNYFDFNHALGYSPGHSFKEAKDVYTKLLNKNSPGFNPEYRDTLSEFASNNRSGVLKILHEKSKRFLDEIFNQNKISVFESIIQKSKLGGNSLSYITALTSQDFFTVMMERFKALNEVVNDQIKK